MIKITMLVMAKFPKAKNVGKFYLLSQYCFPTKIILYLLVFIFIRVNNSPHGIECLIIN